MIEQHHLLNTVADLIDSKKIKTTTTDLFTPINAEKIVKNEFLAVEDISSRDDGKVRYDVFVKAYNETREHGGINGLTPSEMFLETFNRSHDRNNTTQKSVTYVGI
jgi:hypothetical protein